MKYSRLTAFRFGKIWPFALCLLLAAAPAYGQDLDVTVDVDHSRISSTSLNHMDRFDEEVESYFNEYDWTEAGFEEEERIEASMRITLLGVDESFNFEASVVIRSRRPIYNTLRQTRLFYFNDENWVFNYTPNRGLVHDPQAFDSITTLLDFYAHLIIGYDFDSFSELGGTPFFSEAQNLVSLAQTASSTGWSRTGVRRNRAHLANDLLSPGYEPLRKAIYRYHREGLDRFLQQPEEAREQILEALKQIAEVRRNTTNNLLFDLFFNAKYRELVSIFEDASTGRRLEAYNILSQIDPGHLTEYNKLQ